VSTKLTSLVTGGAGFIGSHVVDELVARDHIVIAFDDLSGGFADSVNPSAHFVHGSIGNELLIRQLFNEWRFDYVFHLAAYAAEGLSHFIRRFNYMNNLIGSVHLINNAVNHNVKCFVFTSSIAVYGTNQLPMTEHTIPVPEDPYGIAKYAVELDLHAAQKLFGLNSIIFRPHNVYGERQNIGDKYRNVVGIFMNNILQSTPLPIFGDGTQTRAFSYIGDVAPVIANSINVPEALNQTFNVGADKPYSINELADAVCRTMGVQAKIEYLSARKEVVHAYASHERVRTVFNYEPCFSLEHGLQRMAGWVTKVGARASHDFGELDISKNLPRSWGGKNC
jgi:UDP-glucose 4-epimerase